jgi:hypothetical protein
VAPKQQAFSGLFDYAFARVNIGVSCNWFSESYDKLELAHWANDILSP